VLWRGLEKNGMVRAGHGHGMAGERHGHDMICVKWPLTSPTRGE
jgi:hypothetical protein